MLRKIIYISVFLSLIVTNSFAETYYISNSGDDSNNGISPVFPLKTLEKVNQIISKMKPGDAILFERGSVFYGQINISSSGNLNNPILIGAYGKGSNPVISGSVPVTNWTKYYENIYSAEVNGVVKNLFANGNQMTLARYPNSGYLTIDEPLSDPKKGFTDKQLNQSSGYWNGSIARIRTINWAYEYTPIQSFKNSTLIFKNPTYDPVQKRWGYYLDNNLLELDTAGEWFYSEEKNGKGKVYFYPSIGSNINSSNVQASIFDYGLLSIRNVNNIIIQDLEIRNQSVAGMNFAKGASNLKIDNCTFKGILQLGVNVFNGSNNVINNCRFYEIAGIPVNFPNNNKSSITDNIFKNIGMIPGYGTTGVAFQMSGIYIQGTSNNIAGNFFENIGQGAINCHGTNSIIERNILKNCLLLLNDGGAIKCWGENSNNSIWNNNFIFNLKGNLENTANDVTVALGIYLDDLTNNMRIINNTIVESGYSGIGIHDGYNNLIQNNICFDNPAGINFFQNSNSKNNRIIQNVITSINPDQNSVDVKYIGAENLPGIFDSNYYFNSVDVNSFSVNYRNVISDFNFDTWKSFIKSDNYSEFITGIEVSYPKLFINMSDDSVLIPLSFGYSYKDVNLSNVYGSLILKPWTSEVLFVNSDLSKLPEINAAGRTVDFVNSDAESLNSPRWYNLSGENLKQPVAINAPDGFEVSLDDDTGYSEALTVYPVSGKVDRIIFVKMIQEKNEGYKDFIANVSENITCKVKVEVSVNKQ